MINFLSDELRRNPFPVYDTVRGTSPVLHDPRINAWMLFDYESVKRALTDHDHFASDLAASANKPTPAWLIFFDPPRHTKLRNLVARAFSPRIIAGIEPRIRELSRQLLTPLLERGEMDLATEYAVPLPMMVISGLVGVPQADWPQFRRWSDIILKLSYAVTGGAEIQSAGQEYRGVIREMNAYVPALLEQRRSAPTGDLLTSLVEAEVEGEKLTDQEITAFVELLLVAGQETTANLINVAMLCLMENPGELARLRANRALLPSAIEEILRYRSPLQWVFRGTRRDVELRGKAIPAGSFVLAMLGSANLDPAAFPDPSRFDITRDPNPHVAFGHGIHFCLGAALSRMESRVALTDLLDRMETFERTSGEPWKPRQALHVYGPDSLPIRFQAAKRAAAPA